MVCYHDNYWALNLYVYDITVTLECCAIFFLSLVYYGESNEPSVLIIASEQANCLIHAWLFVLIFKR